MEMQPLRRIRLLLEDLPKNYNLILLGQPQLLHAMNLRTLTGGAKMTLKISDKIIRELLTCVAEYAGPAASQYLKILKNCGGLHSVEWKQMADVFAQVPYLDILEEACFLALKKWNL